MPLLYTAEANVGAGAGSKCELCELFVSRIETYLTDKRTEVSLEKC